MPSLDGYRALLCDIAFGNIDAFGIILMAVSLDQLYLYMAECSHNLLVIIQITHHSFFYMHEFNRCNAPNKLSTCTYRRIFVHYACLVLSKAYRSIVQLQAALLQ